MSARSPWLAIIGLFLASVATAQDLIPHHQDAPPGPALSPEEAVKKMTVPDGFTVEVVAAEPDIVNPVAMTFDEKGRTWITESLEYPRKSPGPGRDRIKILEDTDADGRADKFTVFAEGLNIPSGIAVGYGGVWVANSPDILFYPDADRDGKADGPPHVVVTGFGRADTHELPNSLTWGPDGYLYGLNGVFNHSHIKYTKENPNYKEDHPGWPITCALFRIHPVTREFDVFCEGTSNPWGIAFDHEGSAFVSACVIDHLWHLVRTGYYHRQGGPYPPFTWKIDSIVKHKHQKAAYCGIHYFDSDAYPEQYRNKLYMGNIHGNCINVDKLQRDGSTYFATGEPDFLTANDAWFMPVVQKTGPDGCLYILDWYDRYHCYQDANRDPNGLDRMKGRLYRVRYKDTPRAKPFDLAEESDSELFFDRLLGSNGFFRDQAQRVLVERRAMRKFAGNDPILRHAEEVIDVPAFPHEAKMRAAFVALALHTPSGGLMAKLMQQRDPALRSWAVRSLANCRQIPRDWETLVDKVAGEPSNDVLLQLAIAFGTEPVQLKLHALMSVLFACGDDKLIPHIVWQNLHPLLEDQADEFARLMRDAPYANSPAVPAIVPRVVDRLLAAKKPNAAAIATLFVSMRDHAPDAARDTLQVLSSRIQSGELRGEHLTLLRQAFTETIAPLLDPAKKQPLTVDAAILAASWKDPRGVAAVRNIFSDQQSQAAVRLRALSALVAAEDSQVLNLASKALSEESSRDDFFCGQVLGTLGRLENPQVGKAVFAVYSSLPRDSQPKAIELLTQRASWAKQLFEQIAAGNVNSNLLNVNQIKRVLSFKDAELTAAVAKHYGTVRTTRDPARDQIVTQMRTLVRGIKGDPHRGIAVYNRVCGQCHKIYGQGQDVGPDITANGRASLEQLLSNVFDPSLVIGSAYQARTVQCTDGRILTGLVAEDSPERIVLKVQGGKLETIPRADVEATKLSELSLMPEGLEKQLQAQEIADLFSFITLDKHPDDPSAQPIPSGDVRR